MSARPCAEGFTHLVESGKKRYDDIVLFLVLRVMSKPIIVVGDRTSHGGVVVSGSPFSDVDGKAIARIGDKVTCPQKGHGNVTTIVTGDQTVLIDGSPVARHGDKTACGATLLSSQIAAYVDYGSTTDGNGPAKNTNHVPAANSKLANPGDTQQAYDLQFLVKGEQTGAPQYGVPYRITLDDGRVVTGRTDKNGLTQKVCANYPATASIEAPYHDHRTTDAVCGYDTCCC